jgi:hypothetical protein
MAMTVGPAGKDAQDIYWILKAHDGRLLGIEVLAVSSKLPEYVLDAAERLDAEGP